MELTEREKMIIEFYSEGKIPFLIKVWEWMKGELDKYGNYNNRKLGRN